MYHNSEAQPGGKVVLSNWGDSGHIQNGQVNSSVSQSSEPIQTLDSRACRVLLVADACVNCRQLSYMLTSFFRDCGVFCSFDVFSSRMLLCKVVKTCTYDIIFVPRDLLESTDFIQSFHCNHDQCSIVLYV